ncbi:hypothetical protein ABN702_12430 [Bacillus haimaensis]|uniref:hypothetical protein n=1 Tax=Bacillus haimaensis TaxID=3160967 RepID=UPI003AA9225C
MFQAFDVSKALSGSMRFINESGLIIGFGLSFMMIVFITQLISLFVLKLVEPK